MKANISKPQKTFTPFTLEIKVESKNDLDVLYKLFGGATEADYPGTMDIFQTLRRERDEY